MSVVLLGYVFNFARLCILVLYYIVALRITWLRSRAEMGDYVIGGCLFLVGTFLLFYVVRRLSESPGKIRPPAMIFPGRVAAAFGPSFYSRFVPVLLWWCSAAMAWRVLTPMLTAALSLPR